MSKPAGLLTVPTGTNKTRNAYYFLADHVRKGNPKSRNRIFTVHRLDQWTSGVILFAKSEEIKLRLQVRWQDTEKKYFAVAHGRLRKKQGIISYYLAEKKPSSSIPPETPKKETSPAPPIRSSKNPSDSVS